MFFSNISEYSNKKLRGIYIVSLLVYFLLTLVAPIIVVSANYQMFKTAGVNTLTGLGICLLLAFSVIGLRVLKSKIIQFPENTVPQRRVKFTCQLVYSLFLPLIVVAVLFAMKSNFETAYQTIHGCIWFYLGGILVDNLVVKYVESERKLRFEAQRSSEVNKRLKFFK